MVRTITRRALIQGASAGIISLAPKLLLAYGKTRGVGLAGAFGGNANWLTIPAVTFTQGTAGSFDLAPYAPSGLTHFGIAGDLPAGVTLSGSTLQYDGSSSESASYSISAVAADSAGLADFAARANGPSVVWYNHFDSDAEMNQYRWAGGVGNDPNATTPDAGYMTRSLTGGPDGGPYLQILRKSASAESNVNWWRPLSAIASPGNGKTVNDAAAGGAVALRTWAPASGGNQTATWAKDYYGPTTYDQPFYIQMRLMSDPNAFSFGDSIGKKFYISVTDFSDSRQEIITYAGTPFHRLYSEFTSSQPLEQDDLLARPGQQVGGERSTYGTGGSHCDVGSNPGLCWQFGTNQWDTVLYKITPSSTNILFGATVPPYNIFRIQVWCANSGVTSYTRVWDEVYNGLWDNGAAGSGWNALIFNTYHNNLAGAAQYWQRYAQVIMSLDWIPCPQV